MTTHLKTVVEDSADNPALTPDSPVSGVSAGVFSCLVAWLEQDPSDQKNHAILLALARESLKKARSLNQIGKFDKKDIAEAAGVDPALIDLGSWFRWGDINKYWEPRRDRYIAFARERRIEYFPTLHRTTTQGGRNMVAEHWLEIQKLPDLDSADMPEIPPGSDEEFENRGPLVRNTIIYEVTRPGDVVCAWWIRPWLKHGSFVLKGWRRWSMVGFVLSLGLPLILAFLYAYGLTTRPALINRHTIITLVTLVGLAYTMWHFFVRPIVQLLDDRIIYTNLIPALAEEPAQVELMKEGDSRLMRLVRYTASCAICGATVTLSKGEPDFPRRLVGRCSESPQEHLFSFDRVTRKGQLLR